MFEGIYDFRKVFGMILCYSDIVRKRCCWFCLEKVLMLFEINLIRDVFIVVGIEEVLLLMVIVGLVVVELVSGL